MLWLTEVTHHLLEDPIASDLRRKQPLDVFQDEERGAVNRENTKVLTVQIDPMIFRTDAAVARPPDHRICLAWRPATQGPELCSRKGRGDSPVDLGWIDFPKLSIPSLRLGLGG